MTKLSYNDLRQEAKDYQKLHGCKLTVAQTKIANKYGFNHFAALRAKVEQNNGFIEIDPMESMNKLLAQFNSDAEFVEAMKDFKVPLMSRTSTIGQTPMESSPWSFQMNNAEEPQHQASGRTKQFTDFAKDVITNGNEMLIIDPKEYQKHSSSIGFTKLGLTVDEQAINHSNGKSDIGRYFDYLQEAKSLPSTEKKHGSTYVIDRGESYAEFIKKQGTMYLEEYSEELLLYAVEHNLAIDVEKLNEEDREKTIFFWLNEISKSFPERESFNYYPLVDERLFPSEFIEASLTRFRKFEKVKQKKPTYRDLEYKANKWNK